MSWIDALKLATPIILFMVGSFFGAIRWMLDREEKAQKKEDEAQKQYWATIQENLRSLLDELADELKEQRDAHDGLRQRTDDRIASLEDRLSQFREHVAATYIKRDDWLNHAVNLERKIDNLRNDVHKELQDIVRNLSELRRTQ